MPDVLMGESSPYGTRRASLLRGEADVYLYLEELVDPGPTTASAVWVANHRVAPVDASEVSPPGAPPRMAAGGTRHPDGARVTRLLGLAHR